MRRDRRIALALAVATALPFPASARTSTRRAPAKPATAAPQRPWLLVPEDAQSAALAGRLRAVLQQRAGRKVILLREVAARIPRPIEPAPPASAKALASAIEGAIRRYYYHRDAVKAAKAIEEAVEAAVGLLPRLTERGELWKATRRGLLLLASDALQRGDAGRAEALCRRIAGRDRAFAPPAADWSPRLRAVYARAKAALPAADAPLHVEGPEGMRVFVGGLARGVAPLSFAVVPGTHPVQALHGSVLTAPRSVAVPAKGVRLSFEPTCHVPSNLRLIACAGFLRARAGARVLIRLRVRGGNLEVEGSETSGAAVRKATMELPQRLNPKWLDGLAAFLAGQRDRPPVVEIPTRVVVRTVREPPIYKRWWFWTLVGVLVAGGTTAALVAPRGGRTLDVVIER